MRRMMENRLLRRLCALGLGMALLLAGGVGFAPVSAERVVELCSYDSESVDSATVYGPEGTLYFYFDLEDASREAVEAVLAGLNG